MQEKTAEEEEEEGAGAVESKTRAMSMQPEN